MSSVKSAIGVILLTTMLFSTSAAVEIDDSLQVNSISDTTAPNLQSDTVLYDPGNLLLKYSPVDSPTNFELRRTQNPTVALFKSMLIPGFGQAGNRKFFKAALFLGLDVWFVSSAVKHGDDAAHYRDLFEGTTGDDAGAIALRRQYYDQYQDKRDQRNKYTWYAVIVTFVSMFDAYADAHLSGFPLRGDDNVTISMEPLEQQNAVIASVRIKF